MESYKISLTGDLGSGKSSVGKMLTDRYNLVKVSIGSLQREMAESMNMNTYEFNKYMSTHPEFDQILDNKLCEYENKEGNFLFDSRMAWHFVPSSFKVYMKVDVKIAGERVFYAQREDEKYDSVEDAIDKLTKRRQCEKDRFYETYKVDITNLSNYDIVVDTKDKSKQQVFEEICTAFEKWLQQKGE